MSKRKTSALRKDQDTRSHMKNNTQTFYMNESKTIDFNQAQQKIRIKKPVELLPKTVNQERYILNLLDHEKDITSG